MKALSLKLLRGKIDQVDGVFSAEWVRPKMLNMEEIEVLNKRFETWASEVESIAQIAEKVSPEVVVS